MFRRLRDFFQPVKLGAGVLVEIYGKPDCHLCEVAKGQLEILRQRWGFALREVNIALDEKLMHEFGERIPLIWVEGKLACKFRVEEEQLRQRVRQAAWAKRQSRESAVSNVV